MTTILHLKVLRAANLIGKKDKTNSYVKISLGNKFRGKTKVVKKTLDPSWDEDFSFGPLNGWDPDMKAEFTVFDKSLLKKDTPLGHYSVSVLDLKPGEHIFDESWTNATFNLEDVSHGKLFVTFRVERLYDSRSAIITYRNVEKLLKKKSNAAGGMFEDPDFPPNDSSIYGKTETRPTRDIKWKRLSELGTKSSIFVDGVESGDVIQGSLGDCYFLGALAVIAQRRDLLTGLFPLVHMKTGIFQCRFFKENRWITVTIDDFVPVNASGDEPLYGRCSDINEMWVPLVEKAYAKLHGNYQNIESGLTQAALMEITGEAAEVVKLPDKDFSVAEKEALWQSLKWFDKEKYLLGVSCSGDPSDTEKDVDGMGILKNHAYSVLSVVEWEGQKLLKIRNPWGMHEWKGRWADNSAEWKSHPKILKKYKVKFADDGTFYMCWDDFCKHYQKIHVLRLLTDKIGKQWTKFSFDGEWKGDTAGGCSNYDTWDHNPQYYVSVSKPSELFISLSQPDLRIRNNSSNNNSNSSNSNSQDYSSIGFVVSKTKEKGQKIFGSMKKDEKIGGVDFINSRDISVLIKFPVGEYVLIPSTFKPKIEQNFYLTIFSTLNRDHVEIDLIRPEKPISISGEWVSDNAGGSGNNKTWKKNPAWYIKTTEKCTALFVLTQLDVTHKCYIGLYYGRGKYNSPKMEILKYEKFINSSSVQLELELCPSSDENSDQEKFWIMPATFEPGKLGKFNIDCYVKKNQSSSSNDNQVISFENACFGGN